MKIMRVKFYKSETDKSGNNKQQFLGFVDVLGNDLPDGCSFLARAFRVCNNDQKTANAVTVEEL